MLDLATPGITPSPMASALEATGPREVPDEVFELPVDAPATATIELPSLREAQAQQPKRTKDLLAALRWAVPLTDDDDGAATYFAGEPAPAPTWIPLAEFVAEQQVPVSFENLVAGEGLEGAAADWAETPARDGRADRPRVEWQPDAAPDRLVSQRSEERSAQSPQTGFREIRAASPTELPPTMEFAAANSAVTFLGAVTATACELGTTGSVSNTVGAEAPVGTPVRANPLQPSEDSRILADWPDGTAPPAPYVKPVALGAPLSSDDEGSPNPARRSGGDSQPGFVPPEVSENSGRRGSEPSIAAAPRITEPGRGWPEPWEGEDAWTAPIANPPGFASVRIPVDGVLQEVSRLTETPHGETANPSREEEDRLPPPAFDTPQGAVPAPTTATNAAEEAGQPARGASMTGELLPGSEEVPRGADRVSTIPPARQAADGPLTEATASRTANRSSGVAEVLALEMVARVPAAAATDARPGEGDQFGLRPGPADRGQATQKSFTGAEITAPPGSGPAQEGRTLAVKPSRPGGREAPESEASPALVPENVETPRDSDLQEGRAARGAETQPTAETALVEAARVTVARAGMEHREAAPAGETRRDPLRAAATPPPLASEAAPRKSVGALRFRVEDEGRGTLEVRVQERRGMIEVSVRSGQESLATELGRHLSPLLEHLDQAGFDVRAAAVAAAPQELPPGGAGAHPDPRPPRPLGWWRQRRGASRANFTLIPAVPQGPVRQEEEAIR